MQEIQTGKNSMPENELVSQDILNRTSKSFGYQWREFKEISPEDEEHFLNYIFPVEASFFEGKVGLDAACGFGRHLFYSARYGAKLAIGMDFSDAAISAKENTRELGNARVVKGSAYQIPFQTDSLDYVYCIGALHHMPDPEGAFVELQKYLKPGSPIFIWVYSKSRGRLNALLEAVRKRTTRMPYGILKAICLLAACLDYGLFILPYRLLKAIPGVDSLTPRRIKLYAKFPFHTCFADWFDRLSAPIRFYYNREDMEGWAERSGLSNVKISPTGLYGWRLYGEKPN
ncbi:MAG: methyltransferase domain-containing protein [Nitrospinaceae bacterium]|mgnify:CR=1 FL=1|jgi:SAM-dependent methyltransferase|nr:methyltransferase domain-containing protein [Nitrospinaceae bacterium]MBT3822374.1 methyltransferase domain-containing protein [Nitrospinaceae bacterium]MBT4430710.1 methyltransferase domain-containing protein [Nitrospinaceae bacterium]MBT5369316.1 methyltransferase domain-containing protein [Nitrospinaceae bacterium]MBT5947325.1 methyltransferase domain-containing protein [Nitrospinaceae bacterium]